MEQERNDSENRKVQQNEKWNGNNAENQDENRNGNRNWKGKSESV